MRILIVDDSNATRTFSREALEVAGLDGLEVSEADSGLEALRLLPRGPYDLIITDINMTGVNGLELLSFIRSHELHHTTPVLLISTQQSERDQERGSQLGANGFLAKPFTRERLLEVVTELVRRGASRG